MKFLKKVENTSLKIAKGMLAIFLLKSFLIFGVVIFQACQSDNFYEDGIVTNKVELENFISSFQFANKEIRSRIEILNTKDVDNGLSYQQRIGDSNFPDDGLIDLTEDEAELIMEPVAEEGVNLLKSYGISNSEIIAEFGSLDDPNITTAALAIYRVEQLAQNELCLKTNIRLIIFYIFLFRGSYGKSLF